MLLCWTSSSLRNSGWEKSIPALPWSLKQERGCGGPSTGSQKGCPSPCSYFIGQSKSHGHDFLQFDRMTHSYVSTRGDNPPKKEGITPYIWWTAKVNLAYNSIRRCSLSFKDSGVKNMFLVVPSERNQLNVTSSKKAGELGFRKWAEFLQAKMKN